MSSSSAPTAEPHDARGGRGRAAAFFDLDKTLLSTSAATAFARPFLRGGLLTRRAVLRSAASQVAFVLGSATEGRTERVRARLSAAVAGWEVARVSAVVAAHLHEAVDGVLSPRALELVAEHHAAGHDVVVVSASSEELVRPIAALVGADEVIASRMEVADGRYTGAIAFYAYGEAKAAAMRALAERRGYDLARSTAYTDSATDAPMLAAVGYGVVVHPDRALRRLAEREGWASVELHRPLAVRVLARPAGRVAVVALAAVAVAAGAVVVARGRRRSPHDGGPTGRTAVSHRGHGGGVHLRVRPALFRARPHRGCDGRHN
ncbi:HAD family hydrolase [Cellulomonas sp. NPDC058312]|uniref:HAD family hydrolase n=1 Tax=Cellulomonas sp. NPDC058312 TaxID=3346441 RepID=UPI0036EB6412